MSSLSPIFLSAPNHIRVLYNESYALVYHHMAIESDAISDWYMNSGASDHMTHKRSWFRDYTNFIVPQNVQLGNGESIAAYGKGDIYILSFNNKRFEPIFLTNVLYVPALKMNLFSQRQALDKNCTIACFENKCEVYKHGKVVAVGVCQEYVYRMLFKVGNKTLSVTESLLNAWKNWRSEIPLMVGRIITDDKDDNGYAIMCHKAIPNDNADWYLSSVIKNHMAHNKSWIYNYRHFNKPYRVRMANGKSICAYGQGDIYIVGFNNEGWSRMRLRNVLYVPELKINIFSLSHAMHIIGCTFKSNKLKCELYKQGKVVAIAIRVGNLFRMLFKIRPIHDIIVEVSQQFDKNIVPLSVWHIRLAHQNVRKIKEILQLIGTNYIDDNFSCDQCAAGITNGKNLTQ